MPLFTTKAVTLGTTVDGRLHFATGWVKILKLPGVRITDCDDNALDTLAY
jgi:hypothetical protein